MAAPRNTDVQAKILQATSLLLSTRSFAGVSLADIAKEAGISKGTIYYYYKSKEDILLAILEKYMQGLATRLQDWEGDETKDTSYKRLVRYTLQCGVFDDSGALRLHLIMAASAGNIYVQGKLLEKYKYFKDLLTYCIGRRCPHIDADNNAWTILAVMDGLLVQKLLCNPDVDIGGLIEQTVEGLDAQQQASLT